MIANKSVGQTARTGPTMLTKVMCVLCYIVVSVGITDGGQCPAKCVVDTCDDPDGGCPKCEKAWWGRQCDNALGCYWTGQPSSYRGTKSVTVSGRVCQSWSSTVPHRHRFGNRMHHDAKNYCRSPANHPVPWCYTTDSNARWEECDVPSCDSDGVCPIPTYPIHQVLGDQSSQPFFPGYSRDVIISCGNQTRQDVLWCRANMTWAALKGCQDQPAYCPRPLMGRYSYIKEDHINHYQHNDTIEIQCLKGIFVQGDVVLRCQEDGSWNSTVPNCHLNGSELCPAKCEEGVSCDNEDQGCTTCTSTAWGRHCEYSVECTRTQFGMDYRGTLHRTEGGMLCQAWSSQFPHKHKYTTRVEKGADNYCRNPDMENKPWCYTTNRDVRWQSCRVPNCGTVCPSPTLPMFSHLVEDNTGPFYAGYKLIVDLLCDGENVTMLTTCQTGLTWSHNVSCEVIHCPRPSLNNNTGIVGDGETRLYAHNDSIEVRCPPGFLQKGKDVFVCQGDRTWDGIMPTCDGGVCPAGCAENVPCINTDGACPLCKDGFWGRHCEHRLECYKDKGASYKGSMNMTVSGRLCQAWGSNSPHKHQLSILLYDKNYCRNPDNEPKPWCYTMDPKKRWEVCPVPKCDSAAVCPPPLLPMYSTVLSPVNSPFYTGSSMLVQFICGNTNKSSAILCQTDMTWTLNRLDCDVVFCAAPILGDNSRLIDGARGPYEQNDTIEIGCEDGYDAIGQTIFECQRDSYWNGTMPTCKGVRCPMPLLNPNSRLEDEDTKVYNTYMDVVSVVCDRGYVLVGDAHVHCQANGTWNSSWPTCEVVSCTVPSLSPHSRVKNTTDVFVFGNTVVITCEDGYQLYGHHTFTCQGNGLWDGRMPICKGSCPLHCNATVQCDDSDRGCPQCEAAWWGRHCQYPLGCRLTQKGFEYRGTINSTVSGGVCQAWSVTTPHAHRYGKMVDIGAGNSCRNPDNEASPWCYTTDTDLRWEICPVPLCSSLDPCPPPVLPINISVINPPNTAFFKGYVLLLDIQCDEGYRVEGVPRMVCQSDGTWTKDLPKCQAITCPKPKLSAFSYIEPARNVYQYDRHISVKCIKNYRRTGQGIFECGLDGTWNGTMPICEAPICVLPQVPPTHMIIIGTRIDLRPGTKVTIGCRGGLQPVGSTLMMCLPNGTWDGTLPTCTAVTCPLPVLNNNSYIENPKNSSYVHANVIQVLCGSGYSSTSYNQLVCQLDGSWFGQPPTCTPIVCKPPNMPNIEKYVILPSSGDMEVGSMLQVRCIDGMELDGPTRLTCQKNGSWSYDNSICRITTCPSPPLVNSSVIVRGTKKTYHSRDTVIIICSEGYSPQITVTLACQQDGTWNGSMHRCYALSCQLPTPSDTLRFTLKSAGDLQFGGTLKVECTSGYKTVGNQDLQCEADGQWRGHLPDCHAVACKLPRLYPDMHVKTVTGNGVTPGDVISVWCKPGMRVVGPTALMCRRDGTWNTTTPTCQNIPCLPRNIDDMLRIVRPIKSTYIYKDTVTVDCMEGYELHGSGTIQCGLDSTWGTHQPTCKVTTCRLPPLLPHHILRATDGSVVVGEVISIGCYVHDNVFGFTDLMCTADKAWNASLPTCNDTVYTEQLTSTGSEDKEQFNPITIGVLSACLTAIVLALIVYILIRKYKRYTSIKKPENIKEIPYKEMEHEL